MADGFLRDTDSLYDSLRISSAAGRARKVCA